MALNEMALNESRTAAGPLSLAGLVPRLLSLEETALFHLDGARLVRTPYPELHADVRRVQERLKSWGAGVGVRVGVWGTNSYSWIVHELALLDLGCVTVTLPVTEFAGSAPADLAERYGLELLLADNDLLSAEGAEPAEWAAPLNLDGAGLDGAGLDGAERVVAPREPAAPLDPDVFSIVFSSGTTGTVKAIQLSRVATEDCLAEFGEHHAFSPDDRILVGLPLSTFQQRIMMYCAIWYGFDSIVVEPSPLMFAVLKQAEPTIMGGPPAFYEILESRFSGRPAALKAVLRALSATIRTVLPASLRDAALRRVFAQAHDAYGGRMRLMLSGSAPLRRSTAEVFATVGLPLFQLYGLTESGFISWNRPDANRIGSVGRPVFPGSVRISPEGEIQVRWPRPQSPGYLGEPAEVERATYRPDGWIATGDLGRFDDDGFLHIVGRKKDLIITRGGVKIAPSPWEQQVLTDTAVAQAVMVGGEEPPYVGAVIVLRDHAGDDAAERVRRRIEELNRDAVPSHRVTRVVFTREQFTRENGLMTTTLKINRRAVAARFQTALDNGEDWA
ncbi:AMP-binding protein [Actinomadura barringtoniae]|uniref:AMP-binding protein n=1 Tax=Actinomadura barringtoniae TaxID=1427535 RepID=A0A939P9E9_9ACTN|nr:AMP-binding protein [Actinomadura barringtoniae]MBO2448572.1 AMP-binding protein [Actinomadura barringtoniae]